jgi:hypothetical protein
LLTSQIQTWLLVYNDSMTAPVSIYRRRTFLDIQAELEQAIGWLGEYGPRYYETRIARYRKDIAALVKAYNEGKIPQLLKKRDDETLMNSFVEASDLGIIYRGLRNIVDQDEALTRRIKALIKGPEYSKEEKPSNASNYARNISFELVMASHFAAGGYPIDLGNDADLSIGDGDSMLFVECKRPVSAKSIKSNIDLAFDQLTRRYEESKFKGRKRGFIALSISKIINPAQKLLVGKTEQHLRATLTSIVGMFIQQYNGLWQRHSDKRTLGIIVHFHTPAELEREGVYNTCRQIGINNTTVNGTLDDQYFTEVGLRLHKGVEILNAT